MHKKNTLKNIFRYFSSSLYSTLLGIVNAFIKPKLLSPEFYGLWNILNIIPLYASYSHLGTRTAMRYLLPLKLSEKEYHEVDVIKGNVIFGSLYISLLIAMILTLLGLIVDFSLEVKTGIFTMAAVVLLEWYYLTYVSVLKGYQNFKLLTQVFYLKSTLTFIFGVTFIYFFSIYGLYLALVLSITLTNFYLRYKFSLGHYTIFNISQFAQFVKKGFPMLMFSLGSLIISTSDRIIITSLLGNEQLGYYGISIMILGFFLTIPGATREVMEPALMASMNDNSMQENIRQYFFKPMINLAYFLPFVMGPVFFIVPVLIPVILPDYTDGIIPSQIMIVGGYFLAMSYTARGVIIANNLQLKAIAVMALSIPVNIALSIYFIKLGLGITGVAIGSSFSYLILFISLLIFIKKNCDYLKDDWQQTMKAIVWLFPFLSGVTALLLYILNLWSINEYIAAIFALLVYFITVYYLIKIAAKRYSFLKTVNLKSLFNKEYYS